MTIPELLHRLSDVVKIWYDRQALQADWELERQIRLAFPEDAADMVASPFGSSAARAIRGLWPRADLAQADITPQQQRSAAPVPAPPAGSTPDASSDQADRCGS
ncbi:hypothetical protein QBC99_000111 [Beijerinckia sp. GAS462]|nr:hypothetical protein [Beijerinckia sp. GAS462]SEB52148.1 hypothetical protein SAMN05443249_0314 [Beijerinckia sp. 28-YEA-48]